MRRNYFPERRGLAPAVFFTLVLAGLLALAVRPVDAQVATHLEGQDGGLLDARGVGRTSQSQAPGRAEPTLLYLVRHGETAPDGTRNPPLSPAGERRARWLAVILSHARLDAVYTTDYRRTRSTAGPTAAAHGVQLTVYDPSELEALARDLRARSGRVLVVGHSNTTPALVEALGGRPGAPIEESEHDRLYILVIADDSVRTAVLRY